MRCRKIVFPLCIKSDICGNCNSCGRNNFAVRGQCPTCEHLALGKCKAASRKCNTVTGRNTGYRSHSTGTAVRVEVYVVGFFNYDHNDIGFFCGSCNTICSNLTVHFISTGSKVSGNCYGCVIATELFCAGLRTINRPSITQSAIRCRSRYNREIAANRTLGNSCTGRLSGDGDYGNSFIHSGDFHGFSRHNERNESVTFIRIKTYSTRIYYPMGETSSAKSFFCKKSNRCTISCGCYGGTTAESGFTIVNLYVINNILISCLCRNRISRHGEGCGCTVFIFNCGATNDPSVKLLSLRSCIGFQSDFCALFLSSRRCSRAINNANSVCRRCYLFAVNGSSNGCGITLGFGK